MEDSCDRGTPREEEPSSSVRTFQPFLGRKANDRHSSKPYSWCWGHRAMGLKDYIKLVPVALSA